MLSSYRLPYNLKNLKKDMETFRNITLGVSLVPHQQKEIIHKINLQNIREEDFHFIPEFKFQHLGLNHGRLYFYDEIISVNFPQLDSIELRERISDFLKPYEQLLTRGEFFFHGSALVSLIYDFIYHQKLEFNNINFIGKINSLTHPHHPLYHKLPRPIAGDFSTNHWAHVGTEETGNIQFDYVISLDGEELKMDNFFSQQAFNFSQVYFDYQNKILHYGEGFLDFLHSFTLRLKPENFNLDAFLHLKRLSKTWGANFFTNDYFPLFIQKFDRIPPGNTRIQTPLHFSPEGMSVYNLDSIKPMLGKIQAKNYASYEKTEQLEWLQTSSLERHSFLLSSTPELLRNLPLYETDSQNISKFLPRVVALLFESFGLNYLSLPLSFIPALKDYLSISGVSWTERPGFWSNFIFQWRKTLPSAHQEDLRLLFLQHPFLKERLFEIAHYKGAEYAWAFFDSVLRYKKRSGSTFFRFIGFMENNLSLLIHRTEGDLFQATKETFEQRVKSYPDRVLTIPLSLPWYLKTLVTELKTMRELEVEGLRMRHCVGGYDVKIENGTSRVFHLRTKQGISTMELDKEYNIIQHKGKLNTEPSLANERLATLLIKKLKRVYGRKS